MSLVVSAGPLTGCAMSHQAYAKLAEEIAQRNAERYRTAGAALTGTGHAFADEQALYATLDDGARKRCLEALSRHRLARDPNGEPVLVVVSTRTVSRRKVLVQQGCDHTPGGEPDSFERGIPVRVLFASSRPRQLEMEVEEEILEVTCTENTY